MLLLRRLKAVNTVAFMIVFGALTGAIAFSVVSSRPCILITEALAGAMGLMLTGLVVWVAWEAWPGRLM